jgi:hypothetical protein
MLVVNILFVNQPGILIGLKKIWKKPKKNKKYIYYEINAVYHSNGIKFNVVYYSNGIKFNDTYCLKLH